MRGREAMPMTYVRRAAAVRQLAWTIYHKHCRDAWPHCN